MRVYFSAALASSKDIRSDQANYESLASDIESLGNSVYLPHKKYSPLNNNHTNSDVYKGDMENLLNADLVLALLDTPSLGVGAEIVISLNHSIPVYAFSISNTSRFVSGLLEDHPLGSYIRINEYSEIKDYFLKLSSLQT